MTVLLYHREKAPTSTPVPHPREFTCSESQKHVRHRVNGCNTRRWHREEGFRRKRWSPLTTAPCTDRKPPHFRQPYHRGACQGTAPFRPRFVAELRHMIRLVDYAPWHVDRGDCVRASRLLLMAIQCHSDVYAIKGNVEPLVMKDRKVC